MFANNNNSFASQNTQGAGLFGASSGNQGTGLFGANKPSNGGGLFGAATNTTTNNAFLGAPQTNNAFGAPQNTQGAGLFGGGNNNQPQANGSFFNNPQAVSNPQGGIFGAPQPQQNQQTTSMFGGSNTPQNNGGGIFGGAAQQPNNNGGGIFGAPQNTVQNQPQNTIGIFGNQAGSASGIFNRNPQAQNQNQNQNQNGGIFGTTNNQMYNQQNPSIFGAPSNPGFPQQQTPQNNQPTTGLFNSFNTNTNANNAFLGAQNNTNPLATNNAPNMFNNTLNAQTNQAGSFMTNNQTNAPNNGGGLFNSFANNNPLASPSAANPIASFGPSPNASSNLFAANNNNNKLGGTAWGIPTNVTTNPSSSSNSGSVQPVKSKNSKLLDQKHLIKCIAALDQFNGLSKQEIRIHCLQNGGQQPLIQQQQNAISNPQNNIANSAFKSVGANNQAGVSMNAFGTSNNLFGTTTNTLANNNIAKPTLFGNQAPQNNTFGAVGNLFNAGQPGQPNNGSLLGQQAPTNSLFGQINQQQPAANSLFGQQNAPNTPGLTGTPSFGMLSQPQGSLFNQNPQPANSFFGNNPSNPLGTTNNQQPSLFGNTSAALAGNLLGQNTNSWNNPQGQVGAATSLFGQTQPQGNLFGTPQPQGSLFSPGLGQNQMPQGNQPVNSLFGPQVNVGNPTPSIFGNQSSLGMNQVVNNGAQPLQSNVFAQLANPLVQPMTPMDPNMQMLLPQMLMALALGNNQNNQSNSNATLQVISKLTNLLANQNNNQPTSNNYSQSGSNFNTYGGLSPFDELMKEAKQEKWEAKSKAEENYSVFYQYERQPNKRYDLPIVNLPNEPEIDFSSTYKQKNNDRNYSRRQPLFGGGQDLQRQISKKYRAKKQETKKKMHSIANQLPKIGDFSISPSLDKLKTYSLNELQNVQHVKIWNKYGEIQFLQPISLVKLDLREGITISQDNIEICDPKLQDIKIKMTFRNFGYYSTLKGEEKERLLKKMRKWITKNNMRQLRHEQNGDLLVQI